ncbi:MAG: hypothetical protein IIY21_29470 [Clostridiales bacterium]|nr:hypothetical protein [Lachnospiraceae bacterium]MBQ1298206.1 hypothetical protein [Clostridiales bacterium]MBQ5769305.1 hypothetical protein [Clostridiales bacterium]
MEEDKQLILNKLLDALLETRDQFDLEELVYDAVNEIVTARYMSGGERRINVNMDSGVAMIRDVMEGLR